MDEHLSKSRAALERPGRSKPRGAPGPQEYAEALREMLAYLEELDRDRKKSQ